MEADTVLEHTFMAHRLRITENTPRQLTSYNQSRSQNMKPMQTFDFRQPEPMCSSLRLKTCRPWMLRVMEKDHGLQQMSPNTNIEYTKEIWSHG